MAQGAEGKPLGLSPFLGRNSRLLGEKVPFCFLFLNTKIHR